MRAFQTISNYFRHAKGNFAIVLAVFGVAMITMSIIGISSEQGAQASSNPNNDIVRGGIYDKNKLASACHGDVKTIMKHYWIDCNLAGVVDGRACRDGNVYVGNRVVARNSTSIGRLPISGSHPISIGGKTYYETANRDAFLSECLNAWVKLDQYGSFKYAILKDCGNPIWTPNPVVVPPPKNIQVCELATRKIITIKETEFSSSKHSKNLDDCKEKTIQVCELATKKTITIKESEYDATKHSKDLKDCEEVLIDVCELETKNIITIDEEDFDSSLHSKDITDCDDVMIEVCELATNKVISIKEDDFDSSLYTKDLTECDDVMIEVCELLSKSIIVINEDEFDEAKHSKELKDCDETMIEVCEIESKKMVTIKEEDFDSSIHSKDKEDCKEVEGCVENPKAGITCELPKTGPGNIIMGGAGVASLALSGSYYAASRRDLLNAIINR